MNRPTRLLGALAAATMAVAGCSSDDDGAAPTTAATETTAAPAETTDPEPTEPERTEPATTEPETTASETTVSETTKPDTTEPGTTEVETTDAATTGPERTDAGTTAPAAQPATCRQLPPGVTETTLSAGGGDHPVRIFVPSSFAGTPLPVVLDWHGLGSNGTQQAIYSGYEALADAEGFIAVHPTGVDSSWELADDQDPGRDDLEFADVLMDVLIQDWCADPQRIYSTGMSNGGYFTARLLCERADRIAAAASVAGTYHPEGCLPARSVPYHAYHGTADAVVPFDGSGESVLAGDDPALRAFFEQVMPEEFAEFAADAGCASQPASTTLGADVIRYDYADCAGGTPMAFFQINGGGHTWPSSPIAGTVTQLGYTTVNIDATRDSWAFFEQHALPG